MSETPRMDKLMADRSLGKIGQHRALVTLAYRLEHKLTTLRSDCVEEAAKLCALSAGEIRLMAGELTASELRAVKAVTGAIASKIRALDDVGQRAPNDFEQWGHLFYYPSSWGPGYTVRIESGSYNGHQPVGSQPLYTRKSEHPVFAPELSQPVPSTVAKDRHASGCFNDQAAAVDCQVCGQTLRVHEWEDR